MKRATYCLGLALAFAAAASTADAQEARPLTPTPAPQLAPAQGDTVATRFRPEYDAIGVPVGTFRLYPQLIVNQAYTDNVFATDNDTDSDFLTRIIPTLSLESDWGRHALNARAGGNIGRYAEYTREDFADYFASANGRLDISGDAALFAGGGFAHKHEERSSPNDVNGREPTEFNLIDGFGRYVHQFGRTEGRVEQTILRYDFSNPERAGPGHSTINQDFRDRTEFAPAIRAGYELQRNYEVFVRASGNVRDYDQRQKSTGIDRSSHGYAVVGGVDLDLGGVVFGDVFAGVLQQYYDDFSTVTKPTFGTSLTWTPTGLTTVNARVIRVIEEAVQSYSSAYLQTLGTLTVDHELLRNLILTANVAIGDNDYLSSKRNDMIYQTGIGARYLVNRNVFATAGYSFFRRSAEDVPSGFGNPDFSENVFRIGVGLQM